MHEDKVRFLLIVIRSRLLPELTQSNGRNLFIRKAQRQNFARGYSLSDSEFKFMQRNFINYMAIFETPMFVIRVVYIAF